LVDILLEEKFRLILIKSFSLQRLWDQINYCLYIRNSALEEKCFVKNKNTHFDKKIRKISLLKKIMIVL